MRPLRLNWPAKNCGFWWLIANSRGARLRGLLRECFRRGRIRRKRRRWCRWEKRACSFIPHLSRGLKKRLGRTVDFAREGTFEVFAGPDGENARDKMIEEYRDLGLAIETISVAAARGLEPELGAAVSAAAWLPDEATVDPRLLTEAVLVAAERRGAEIRGDCAVESLLCERGACTGVSCGGRRKSRGRACGDRCRNFLRHDQGLRFWRRRKYGALRAGAAGSGPVSRFAIRDA